MILSSRGGINIGDIISQWPCGGEDDVVEEEEFFTEEDFEVE